MADFELWASAAAASLVFSRGDFATAYRKNRSTASLAALESSLLAETLIQFCRSCAHLPWEGICADLLRKRASLAQIDPSKPPHGWPGSSRKFTNGIKRLAPALREAGFTISRPERSGSNTQGRLVVIDRAET